MTVFSLSADFSARPEVLKVEQKFGLAGLARMIKLLELLAKSPTRDAGLIELALSDWQEVLQQGTPLLMPFLIYLQQAGWLVIEQDESGSPLRVTIRDFQQYLSTGTGVCLFESPEQWRAWFVTELGGIEQIVGSPESVLLFKRWCANNVTTNEVEAAIELAIEARQAPTPGVLHGHVKTVRKLKIEQALR